MGYAPLHSCLGLALHTQSSPLTSEEHTNAELCKYLRAKARAKLAH